MKTFANGLPIRPTQTVADQAARLALTPAQGDVCYQEDIQVTYQWREDDGTGATWRAINISPIEDIYFGGTPSIYYHVDPAGDDDNDGRDLGAGRAKQTLGAVFKDLNDAGVSKGHPAGGFSPYVEIRMAPGAYSQSGFADLILTASIPGGLYIVPQFGDYANNETVTISVDNGVISGSATEHSLTTNAFTSFGRGERFLWRGDGFTPNGDVFPNVQNGCCRPSTSPDLRILNPASPFWTTAFLSQYETTLDHRGIEARDPQTSIFIYGLEMDNSSTTLVTYQNVAAYGCRFRSTGGSSVVFVDTTSPFTLMTACYIQFPNQINARMSANSGNQWSLQQCDVDQGRFDFYSGFVSCYGTIFDDSPRWGSFTPSQASLVSGQMNVCDFLDTNGPSITGYANVRQLGDWYMPNVTTSFCIKLTENSRFTRQTGDLIAANPGLTGPAIVVEGMSQAINVSNYTGIVTTPVGQDIKVGARPVSALASLPRTDYSMGDTSEGCRAT